MSSSSISNSTHILYGITLFDLPVIACLRNSTHILCGITLCELQQNLCNSNSSLVPDTSPSFSPLSSVFHHLTGSLLWNHLSTPSSKLLQYSHLPLPLLAQKYNDHTLTNLRHICTSFLCMQNIFSTLIPL